jgi:hypothetical protein
VVGEGVLVDNATTSALIAFLGGLGGTVVLLMPGYVLGSVYSRGIRGPAVSDRAFVAVSALGGLATHLLGLPITVPLIRGTVRDGLDHHIWFLAAGAAVVLLVLPAVIGAGLGILAEGRVPFSNREAPSWLMRLLNNLGLTVSVRTQEAWNWVFHRRQAAWVRIRLKGDEGIILGKFGKDSFASSDANLRDIYLQELWAADEDAWFFSPYPTTRGVWVSGSDMQSIEFFEGQGDDIVGEGG